MAGGGSQLRVPAGGSANRRGGGRTKGGNVRLVLPFRNPKERTQRRVAQTHVVRAQSAPLVGVKDPQ